MDKWMNENPYFLQDFVPFGTAAWRVKSEGPTDQLTKRWNNGPMDQQTDKNNTIDQQSRV